MRRFDVNCTLGRWADGGPTFATAEDLLANMDRLGIDKALVRHSLAAYYDPSAGNGLLMEQMAGCERLLPCWTGLPPVTGELGELHDWLAALTANGVRAVALYPIAHGYPLTPWQCGSLLDALAERRYLVLIELAETNWEALHTLCGAYPALRVALLTPGYRVLRPLYGLLAAHENLYLDLSTMTNFGGIEALAARFGADRLLLGTGQPRNEGAGIVAALNYAALETAQVQRIAADNLERLLAEVRL
jgi:hypothetical protein